MNKGLFYNLLTALICWLLYQYILFDEPETMQTRLTFLGALTIIELFVTGFCDINFLYNKKI